MNTHANEGLAARASAVSTLAVAAIVAALHGLKPEFVPSWRFVSEYAIGEHGWVMKAGFVLWALSCAFLVVPLWREVQTLAGKAGVAILALVAAALVMAGVFPMDPVTIKPHEATADGSLHGLASMVGIPGLPLAAMLISASLWRRNRAWASYRAPLMFAAHATWISLVLMSAYLMWAVPRAGGFTPDVWAGWMNRFVIATYLAWQGVVAVRLIAQSKAPGLDKKERA